ncbi:hypothetical protein HYN48_07535 [Flavobacterium magnum]|uniref:DUF4468 domain-containing protein n=1 Tax=Flavobacterium magnum TaxID=2162713 RepID=A0A2S0RFS5_9FLAO|nr:hypothetical protein [Flavobacterium magnum]AWA29941.1 hypothetical protein HYN48_07535 [Flavobacterium magnum]
MKKLFLLLALCSCALVSAQIKMELTPSGFAPVESPLPAAPVSNLIETAKGWAYNYNRKNVDVYDVTENSLKIDGLKDNGFYYINRGQKYVFKIKYTLGVVFDEKTYKVTLIVKEILGKDDKPQQSTLADYFTSDGKIKEDYTEMLPSLEYTASQLVGNFIETISRSN